MPNDPQRQDPQPGRGLQQAQPVLPAQRREQQAPQQQYAEARAHRVLDRAADAVWREVRDFPALAAWHPGIASSTAHPDNPRVRDLVTTDGTRLTEALHAVDDTLMSLEYGFVAHPFPLTGYRARMEVARRGRHALFGHLDGHVPAGRRGRGGAGGAVRGGSVRGGPGGAGGAGAGIGPSSPSADAAHAGARQGGTRTRARRAGSGPTSTRRVREWRAGRTGRRAAGGCWRACSRTAT
ncbi:SRPBCC family protein [Streptomyces albus]|nr:SRPBCC family protein [Streptomyces albus]